MSIINIIATGIYWLCQGWHLSRVRLPNFLYLVTECDTPNLTSGFGVWRETTNDLRNLLEFAKAASLT